MGLKMSRSSFLGDISRLEARQKEIVSTVHVAFRAVLQATKCMLNLKPAPQAKH